MTTSAAGMIRGRNSIPRFTKSYTILFWVVFGMVLFFLILAVSLPMGGGVPETWWGFLIAAAIVCAASLVARYITLGLYLRRLRKLVRGYDESCDPGAFLLAAYPVFKSVKGRLGIWDAWFLGYWAMALDDAGDACGADSALRRALSAAKDAGGLVRAEMELQMYAATAQIDGFEAASALLDDAELELRSDPGKHADKLSFIEREREKGSLETPEGWRAVREDASAPMRARVNAALREADASRSLEDAKAELAALEFASESGPMLKSGREARRRLAEA